MSESRSYKHAKREPQFMPNVLILSAGRRVSLLRGFQEAALAHKGCKIFAADAAPAFSAACHAADASFKLPRVSDPEYKEALLALCDKNDIRLIVPTIDPELGVLSKMRAQLSARGIEALVCSTPLVDIFADKRATAAFFKEIGLPTPDLYAQDTLHFPVFVKPYDGSLSAGAQLLMSEKDLTPAILQDEKNIFCEYIDHRTHAEFTCDLYFDHHGDLKCAVPRKRLEVRGGEVSKGEACKNDIVDQLFDCFAHLEGARGVLTVQLFRHEETGRSYYIEVNPRFGGGYPLTRCAGADFQAWLLREYLNGEAIDLFHDWRDGAIMLRYDAEIITQRQ